MKINIGTYSLGGGFPGSTGGPTLLEKLKTIKELGYDGVEFLANDMNNSVEDLKAWLEEAGLEVAGLHAAINLIEENIPKIAALGGNNIVCPNYRFNCKEEAIELAKELERLGKIAEPYGIKIGYHNHSQEFWFDGESTLEEYILNNSDPKYVYMQLDCGWAQNGGCYPPTFIRKYKNRFLGIHVKENCKITGPGGKPAGHSEPNPMEEQMKKMATMSEEEKAEFFKQMQARRANQPLLQCKMGAPESNINWKEIKAALDEQDFEAFWVVEREGFYDEHDKCIAEDCAWLHENIK